MWPVARIQIVFVFPPKTRRRFDEAKTRAPLPVLHPLARDVASYVCRFLDPHDVTRSIYYAPVDLQLLHHAILLQKHPYVDARYVTHWTGDKSARRLAGKHSKHLKSCRDHSRRSECDVQDEVRRSIVSRKGFNRARHSLNALRCYVHIAHSFRLDVEQTTVTAHLPDCFHHSQNFFRWPCPHPTSLNRYFTPLTRLKHKTLFVNWNRPLFIREWRPAWVTWRLGGILRGAIFEFQKFEFAVWCGIKL